MDGTGWGVLTGVVGEVRDGLALLVSLGRFELAVFVVSLVAGFVDGAISDLSGNNVSMAPVFREGALTDEFADMVDVKRLE